MRKYNNGDDDDGDGDDDDDDDHDDVQENQHDSKATGSESSPSPPIPYACPANSMAPSPHPHTALAGITGASPTPFGWPVLCFRFCSSACCRPSPHIAPLPTSPHRRILLRYSTCGVDSNEIRKHLRQRTKSEKLLLPKSYVRTYVTRRAHCVRCANCAT